ncbi:hypothetical protein [Azospirillum rugosum]|uniref:Uncharacterized protein n=1 Tax=Azospirillum rugosum TaxID=416170 RepID=A0ABS4SDV8_9PROT|nr:hypothetical protein [Azospirillum rugosum]MBP2290760.1 hypothetical protein [Azospirillum rugosum]MDQ0525649.1 hypothetical protein [Azospirillum rugosum]
MKLTEKDARSKWCPHARHTAIVTDGGEREIGVVAANRGYSDGEEIEDKEDVFCKASDCMAWRWSYSHGLDDVGIDKDYYTREKMGYCGAFGKPVNP